jgi:hypothetical protein
LCLNIFQQSPIGNFRYIESGDKNRGRVRSRSCLPLLIKPCVRFSRTRLSDVLHRKACALVQPAVVGAFLWLRGRTKLTPRYLKQSIGNTRPKQAYRPFFSTEIVSLTNSPLRESTEV